MWKPDLSTVHDSNNGEDREKIVAEEIEDRSNNQYDDYKDERLTDLGTVLLSYLFFNIGISIFVFLLTGS